MVLVSEHFTLSEFACHSWRDGSGNWHPILPYPQQWVETRLEKLCGVLEAVRAEVGLPVVVLCGYRSPEYNQHLRDSGHSGVASGSQHMQGTAADIYVKGMAPAQVHETIRQMELAGRLPDLGGLGRYPGFTHVDVRDRHGGELARWNG